MFEFINGLFGQQGGSNDSFYSGNNLYVNPFRSGDQAAQDTLADLYEAEFEDYLRRFFQLNKILFNK